MGLLTKDWWNVKGSVKRLRPGDVNPRPFKPANPSPFRDLVFLGGLKPMYIRIDPAHTFAIDGIGKNYYASGLVLLVMMGGGVRGQQRTGSRMHILDSCPMLMRLGSPPASMSSATRPSNYLWVRYQFAPQP